MCLKELLTTSPPKRLLIMGCGKLNGDSNMFDTEWKFISTSCEYLESTLDCVQDFQQCDTLINMFREKYNDQLDIRGLDEGMLTLSVCNT